MGSDFEVNEQSSTKKPNTEGFKKTAQRLRDGKENHLSHRSILDWRLDQRRVCESFGDTVDYLEISELKEIILQSRTGEALLSEENTQGLKIYYDPQTPLSQFYKNGDEFVIAMNPHRSKGELLNVLVRELRHVAQHRNDALVNPMSFEPDGAILVNRAQQSDVFMVSVKVAWELKLLGENEAWDFMAASPQGDIIHAFEVSAQKDFRTLNNGEASRAAYDKFFDDNHTKSHDKRIIHQMLLDDKGYMKAGEKISAVGMELFRKLGEVPHSVNYLSSATSKDLPVAMRYFSVEDRSNANFLWFIKFERSFQEKEMQIVQESVKKTAEIVDFAKTLKARRSEAPVL